jgi:hypothetical protein
MVDAFRSTKKKKNSRTLGQRAHQRPEMIGLLQLALANQRQLVQIAMDLRQELLTDAVLAVKEPEERILHAVLVAGHRRDFLQSEWQQIRTN